MVVIVGVIIVAISMATVGDGRKPATAGRRAPTRPRADPPTHLAPAEVVAHGGRSSYPRPPGLLLAGAIVSLGSLTAVLVGGTLLVSYVMLRSALG